MTTWAVLASGESMSAELAAKVKHLPTVAVSNAFEFAPWAKAIIACDGKWWRKYPKAMEFAGDKFCANGQLLGIPRMRLKAPIYTGSNSGLLGLYYAIEYGKAKRVLLLGIDMKGRHFFGDHQQLPNTSVERFEVFKEQFREYAQTINGVDVINCNRYSALEVFPKMALAEALNA